MAKEPHSAIPSWSGYIYQGKIAFYEVLRVIKKQLNEDVNYDFSDYALEVEWQEDFALKIGDNYKSIHQVKAYKENTEVTKYKEALGGLLRKVQFLFVPAYLHIWTPIIYNSRTTSFEKYRKKNFNFKYYPKKYNQKIQVYKYCTGKETCDLDEADELILKKIEEIYQVKNFGIESLTMAQFKYIRFKLYELLDTHILEIHKGLKDKKSTIGFNEILEIFRKNYEEYSIEYQHIMVKNKLLYFISRYCMDEDLCSEGQNECNHDCILFKAEKKLNVLDAKEVYKIILNATPQYRDYDSLIQENGIKYGFIRILHQLTDSCRTNEFHYKTDKYYLPTTITEPRASKEIAKNILENKELELLVEQFEIDIFISDNVKIESLEGEAKILKDVGEDGLEGLFEKKTARKIDKIKRIQVKPIDDIKEDINNAD